MRREAKEMKNVSSHVAVKERKDRIAVYIQKKFPLLVCTKGLDLIEINSERSIYNI